ncbi:hypothetical protein PG994_000323 [Apiospora phragmitis]|uniref:Uncharacterized protein n=1 Tax=Apiospora phragmitis TaxID=2905665 RepID=A0ABR1X5X0_9PEZI
MKQRSQQILVEEEQDGAATPRRTAPSSNNGRIGNIVSNFAWRHARKKSKDSNKDANEVFEDDADEVKAIIEQSSRRRPGATTTVTKGLQQRSPESTTK